jgi:hypothetical protein
MGNDDKHCERKSSLETTFVSDTQAYGVMFTVATKQDLLLIETIEITAVAPDREKDVHVIVYTKEGDYHGYQNQPDQWVSIADTTVIPSIEGRGILIQPQEFHPVEVTPNNRRSFYVTLDTANLRYSDSPGRTVGAVYSEDEYLQIEVGAGLLGFPFPDQVNEPRVFCGILHYKRMISCDSVTKVQTKVVYHFIVQHDSTLAYDAIQSKVNVIVSGTIMALLQSDINLLSFQESASLHLEDIQTEVPSTPFHSGAYSECVSNTVRVCTPVATRMTFGHTDRLKAGDVIFQILQHRAKVSTNLDAGTSMDVVYAGWIPIKSNLVLRLDGTPKDQNMNAIQQAYMEDIMKRFLMDRMARIPSAQVLEVQVNYQQSLGYRRNLQDNVSQQRPLASIDIFASISGNLKPPNIIDFESLTENIIQKNTAEFLNELKIRRDLTLDPQNSFYFANIQHISVGSEMSAWKSQVDIPSQYTLWVILLGVGLVCCFAAMLLSIWRLRRNYLNSLDPEKKPFQDTTEQFTMDDIDEAYENAFRGIIDLKEAEIMNQKAYSEELHAPDSPKPHSLPQIPMPLFHSSKRNQIHTKEHLVRIKSLDPAAYMASQRDLKPQDSSRDIKSANRSLRQPSETADVRISQRRLLVQNTQRTDPTSSVKHLGPQVLSPQEFLDSMLRQVGESPQINIEEWAHSRSKQEGKYIPDEGFITSTTSSDNSNLKSSNRNYNAPISIHDSALEKQDSRKEMLTRKSNNRFSDRSLPSSRSSGSLSRNQSSDRSLQSSRIRHEYQEMQDHRLLMKVNSDRSIGRNLLVEPQRSDRAGHGQQNSMSSRSLLPDQAKGRRIDVFEGERASSRRLLSEKSQSQRDLSRERSLISDLSKVHNTEESSHDFKSQGMSTLKHQIGRQSQSVIKSELDNHLRRAASDQRLDSKRPRDQILKSSHDKKSSQRSLHSQNSMYTNHRVETNNLEIKARTSTAYNPDTRAPEQKSKLNLNVKSFDGNKSSRMLNPTDRRLQIQRSMDNRNVHQRKDGNFDRASSDKELKTNKDGSHEYQDIIHDEGAQFPDARISESQGDSEPSEINYEASTENSDDHDTPILIVNKKFLSAGAKIRLIDDVSSMGSQSGTSSSVVSEHTVKRDNRGKHLNNTTTSSDESETTMKRTNIYHAKFDTIQE